MLTPDEPERPTVPPASSPMPLFDCIVSVPPLLASARLVGLRTGSVSTEAVVTPRRSPPLASSGAFTGSKTRFSCRGASTVPDATLRLPSAVTE